MKFIDNFLFNESDWPIVVQTLILALVAILILVLLERVARILVSIYYFSQKIGESVRNRLRSHALSEDERQYLERYRRFADHVESEVRRLNNLESWSHYRFTELEAEVEAEGGYYQWRFPFRQQRGLRRESSFSKALEHSHERLILVEGDPGAGKSVALRQVTLMMANKAMKQKDFTTSIPVYINLKNLSRPQIAAAQAAREQFLDEANATKLRLLFTHYFTLDEIKDICFDLNINYENLPGDTISSKSRELILFCQRTNDIRSLLEKCASLRPQEAEFSNIKAIIPADTPLPTINQELIRQFVFRTLNRANDRDIEAFLETSFDRGMQEGRWVFFFDSFDEIPEILSSTDADTVIQQYGDAISDFLGGMNTCRGVVASRAYRGPQRLGWPRFIILPLSPERQKELISKTGLKSETTMRVIASIQTADQSIHSMASNPLFLGLVSEFVQQKHEFPQTTYAVFEEYISERLSRDEERLWRRFYLKPTDLRDAAEKLAFSMTADQNLGLNPTRNELHAATKQQGFDLGDQFHTLLDALEFLKLARTETSTSVSEQRAFSFSHRRFQEYFATSIVLRDPSRVPPRELLLNGRWRETAVVLGQTQSKKIIEDLLSAAQKILTEMTEEIPNLQELPKETDTILKYESESPDKWLDEFSEWWDEKKNLPLIELLKEIFKLIDEKGEKNTANLPFPWPNGLIHLLSVLQEGFSNQTYFQNGELSYTATKILWSAQSTGLHYDQKWALEVIGVMLHKYLGAVLSKFFDKSKLLSDIAYEQTVRLKKIPSSIETAIINTLASMLYTGQLKKEKLTIYTHLERLPNKNNYLTIARRLNNVPLNDLLVHFLVIIALFYFNKAFLNLSPNYLVSIFYLFVFFVFYLIYTSFDVGYKRIRNWRTCVLAVPFIVLLTEILTLLILFPSNSPSQAQYGFKTLNYLFPENSSFLNALIAVISYVIFVLISFTVPGNLIALAKRRIPFRNLGSYVVSELKFICRFMFFLTKEVALLFVKKRGRRILFDIIIIAFPIILLREIAINDRLAFSLLFVLNLIIFGFIIIFLPILIPLIKFLPPIGYLKYRRIIRSLEVKVSTETFLFNLSQLEHSEYQATYVREVYQRQMMTYNRESEAVLINLIALIQLSSSDMGKIESYFTDELFGSKSFRQIILSMLAFLLFHVRYEIQLKYFYIPPLYAKLNEKLVRIISRSSGLSSKLESSQITKEYLKKTNPKFKNWFDEHTNLSPFGLYHWHKLALLDELSLLLEQVRATRNQE